jgi:hypothetical protein
VIKEHLRDALFFPPHVKNKSHTQSADKSNFMSHALLKKSAGPVITLLIVCIVMMPACSGSKKYFKAAEKLEKQGLVSDAAEYYMESLQRKPTNVEARIKLKQVGQKYVSGLASEFFRNYNTQQLEPSLETFERLKEFNAKAAALNVQLDYPKTYDDDYQKSVETFCSKNYNQAFMLVNQKKYGEATTFINKVKKYNGSYRNLQQLEIVAVCEPLYQSAINNLENKNYSGAYNLLTSIRAKTENYKDMPDLLELATAQQTKSFILFEPKASPDQAEKEIEEYLFNNFSEMALQKFSTVKIINNTPFQNAPGATDLSNSDNLDLIQAIRKATGADYFYIYDVSNKRELNSGLKKTTARGYQEVKTRKNDTTVITEFKPFDYNVVRAQRSFSYDFKYKLINAYTNQIVSTQVQNIKSQDAVEYQEFMRAFSGNINTLYPYNPQQTAPLAKYNPRSWRELFSARNNLKTFEELKGEALKQNVNLFGNTANSMK